ncbi:MAG: glutaredoxin 3 [Gammaproteobacteria bacterium]
MAEIIIYTKSYCPYCDRAKALLQSKGLSFKEISIEHDEKLREEMIAKSGRKTVPQIFINDQSVGGFDDLYALQKSGELDQLLM